MIHTQTSSAFTAPIMLMLQCLQRGEIIFDKVVDSSIRAKKQCLSKESSELARFITELEDSILSLQNTQQRYVDITFMSGVKSIVILGNEIYLSHCTMAC